MLKARPLAANTLLGLAGMGAVLLLAGVLSACASSGGGMSETPQTFTESDEPPARKRATNRLKLAVLYFQDAKYNFALDETKQAILSDPAWFEPYAMRGLIYLQTGEYALAEASLQKALAIQPGASDVKHNYGVLLCRMARPDEATKLFSAALADSAYAQRAKTWAEQGRCQLGSGQTAAAEASFLRAYELDAGNAATGYALGKLLLERGELTRSQFYIRRINNSDGASAASLWLGAKVEHRLGNQEAKLQLQSQLRKRFAQSPEAMASERGAFNE